MEEKEPKSKETKSKPKRPYPRIALEECLIVGKKIRELNGGNPWTTDEIAKAIGIGKMTNNFAYYTGSSREFGITNGSRLSETIGLEPLGKQIIYAGNPTTELEKKREAFFKIQLFKDVYDHYNGANLPEMTYLKNTLESKFKLNPEFHAEFREVFIKNCKDLGLEDSSAISTNLKELDATEQEEKPEQIQLTPNKKKSSAKSKIFVAIPFSEKNPNRPEGFFKEVLASLITPAVTKAGFEAYTANIKGSDIIHSTIINELLDADLVIADLTDHNPNVLFELGMRMALDKPVVIIKAKGTGGVFDVDNMMRYFEYNPVLWKSTLETDIPELAENIQAAWENKDNGSSYMQILRKQKI